MTGGAGFLGHVLTSRFLYRGHAVTIFDKVSVGDLKSLRDGPGKLQFERGDILDVERVGEAMKGKDAVVHLAALTSVSESFRFPKSYEEVNSFGTLSVLRSALAQNVRKFVFASSSAVYGQPGTLPATERSRLRPLSPYAVSKVSAEETCRQFSHKGLDVSILRIFNLYGPISPARAHPGVVAEFIDRISAGKQPVIYGDGNQVRDFVHVDDVVACVVLVLESGARGTYNLGTGVPTSINKLATMIAERASGSRLAPIHRKTAFPEVKEIYADITKARKNLGWIPKFSIDSGIDNIIGDNV